MVLACVSPAPAAPEGTMTIGIHVTLVSRWLDPAETEGLITMWGPSKTSAFADGVTAWSRGAARGWPR